MAKGTTEFDLEPKHVPFPTEELRPHLEAAAGVLAKYHADRIERKPSVMVRFNQLGAWRSFITDQAEREFRTVLDHELRLLEWYYRGALEIRFNHDGRRS